MCIVSLASYLFLHKHDLVSIFYLILPFRWLHMQTAGLVVVVDDDGCFIEKITDFKGQYVKEADKDIINAVKASCCFNFPWTRIPSLQ